MHEFTTPNQGIGRLKIKSLIFITINEWGSWWGYQLKAAGEKAEYVQSETGKWKVL